MKNKIAARIQADSQSQVKTDSSLAKRHGELRKYANLLNIMHWHRGKDKPGRLYDEAELSSLIDLIKNSPNLLDLQKQKAKEGITRRLELGYSVTRPPLGYSASATRGLYHKNSLGYSLGRYFRNTVKGKMSTSQLQRAVSRQYYLENKERQSRLISVSSLKSLVSNPYYSGIIKYRDREFRGLHIPLITPAEQKKLIALLKR